MLNSLQKWFWRITILVLFAVSLGYVLLQANGFQFDTYTNQFRRTGIINVEYSDPEAMVFLDGHKLDGTLPFVATNVLPGEYTLVVAREGYWDYQTEVSVSADLITRVNSVFLAPMYPQSKVVWEGQVEEGQKLIMAGGYLFRQEGQTLKWAKINDRKLDFLSLDIPLTGLREIQVFEREALLTDGEGHRGLLDLGNPYFKPIGLDSSYRYIGERWLYFEDDVLALFDRQMEQVIWARQPQLGIDISDIRYFRSLGREFVAVDFSGAGEGMFYELKASGLQLVVRGEVVWAQVSQEGRIDYLTKTGALWSFSVGSKNPELVARFSEKVEMVTSDWGIYGAMGVLLFKDAAGYWLCDRGMENAQLIFPAERADELILYGENRLYFLGSEPSGKKQTLEVWNLAV